MSALLSDMVTFKIETKPSASSVCLALHKTAVRENTAPYQDAAWSRYNLSHIKLKGLSLGTSTLLA